MNPLQGLRDLSNMEFVILMTMHRWILLRMRHISNKSCRENLNTHFMFSNFFLKSRRLWDNVEKCGGAWEATNNVTIWRIRVECWISKATRSQAHAHRHAPGHPRAVARARARTHTHTHKHTHTQICNTYCFSMARIIRQFASMLRYTYIACLIKST
jgi:hypothetical protein